MQSVVFNYGSQGRLIHPIWSGKGLELPWLPWKVSCVDFVFIWYFSNFYLNSSYHVVYVILVSGGEFSYSSLTYNTQCSIQVPSLISITHLAHQLSTSLSSTFSLFSIFRSLLWFSSLFPPFPHVHLFCFLNSTYEWNHMVFVYLWLIYFTENNTL